MAVHAVWGRGAHQGSQLHLLLKLGADAMELGIPFVGSLVVVLREQLANEVDLRMLEKHHQILAHRVLVLGKHAEHGVGDRSGKVNHREGIAFL